MCLLLQRKTWTQEVKTKHRDIMKHKRKIWYKESCNQDNATVTCLLVKQIVPTRHLQLFPEDREKHLNILDRVRPTRLSYVRKEMFPIRKHIKGARPGEVCCPCKSRRYGNKLLHAFLLHIFSILWKVQTSNMLFHLKRFLDSSKFCSGGKHIENFLKLVPSL
jgi:hypothetical protein